MESSFATVHNVLSGSAFLTGFALVWGANDFHLGLLGAIPFLGYLFQPIGAYLADRWPDHRRLSVAWIGLFARGIWFVMAFTPFLAGGSTAHCMFWILILYMIHQALNNSSGPGWVAWMAVLVPPRLRGRYFGRRNRVNEIFGIITVMTAGVALDAFRGAGADKEGFAVLQVAAGVAGLFCFAYILRQPDPGHDALAPEFHIRYLLRPLRDLRFRRLVTFNACWLAGLTVCTPFLNAHLLKNMNWDFKSLSVLVLLNSVGAILMNPFWGRMADRHGHKQVLILCSLGLLLLPLFYLFCPWNMSWPVYFSNLLSGIFLSGFNLALFSLTLAGVPAEARAMGSAVMAAVAGPAIFIAGALSGWAAEAMSDLHWVFGSLDVSNYQILFMASMVLRIPAFCLITRIHEHPTAELIPVAGIGSR